MTHFLTRFFLSSALLLLGLTAKADLTVQVQQDKPVVVDADFTFDYTDEHGQTQNQFVGGPWTHFNLEINNQGASPVRVIEVLFSGDYTAHGQYNYFKQTYTPQTAVPPLPKGQNALIEIAAGQTASLSIWMPGLPSDNPSHIFDINGTIAGVDTTNIPVQGKVSFTTQ